MLDADRKRAQWFSWYDEAHTRGRARYGCDHTLGWRRRSCLRRTRQARTGDRRGSRRARSRSGRAPSTNLEPSVSRASCGQHRHPFSTRRATPLARTGSARMRVNKRFPELELRQVDPARGRARRYHLARSRSLFGERAILITWGRIGRPARVRIETFGSEAKLQKRWQELLARRRAHGYLSTRVTARTPETDRATGDGSVHDCCLVQPSRSYTRT